MSTQKCCTCVGTKEQNQKLHEIIEKCRNKKGALIPILHEAQELFGYLPLEVQKTIAEELDMPLAEVYGVVTFYGRFTLNPKGKYQVSVCLGTACYVKGSGDILERLKQKLGIDVGECTKDGKFSIEATRCLGACGLAPVMVVNEDVYGKLTPDDVDDIIDKYMDKD